MEYLANKERYNNMIYRKCGKSGLKLPLISLGMWHNFGEVNNYENSKKMVLGSFDMGINHFDLANNYGPPPGSAEETMGKILSRELKNHRDELIISSKAGYRMWDGPYGDGGSKKYLISSLDQSLKRMNLDYVDIFYSHRFDSETPLEETMAALAQIVKQGKALYVGISSYDAKQTKEASRLLKEMGTNCLIHQPKYSMFERWIENGLLDVLAEEGIGSIAFSPLAQGMLTNKYLHGIPADSRAADINSPFLNKDNITEEKLRIISVLDSIASGRGQSLAQMALAWVLQKTTSVIIGASRLEQISENIETLKMLEFTKEELEKIDEVLRK